MAQDVWSLISCRILGSPPGSTCLVRVPSLYLALVSSSGSRKEWRELSPLSRPPPGLARRPCFPSGLHTAESLLPGSLDPGDNEQVSFLSGMIAALQKLDP